MRECRECRLKSTECVESVECIDCRVCVKRLGTEEGSKKVECVEKVKIAENVLFENRECRLKSVERRVQSVWRV